MKRSAWMASAITCFLLLSLTVVSAADTRTLTGEYHWNAGTSGDLEAVFTPTGDGTWDVSFHFRFRGRAHTYTGTAQGSLSQGELKGKVKNENKARTFTFSGKMEDGSFRGSHAETTGGSPDRTGTMTLGS
jgi:hypothetical protein